MPKKFLIVGLGNPGEQYAQTRHNVGFKVLDCLCANQNTFFETEHLGQVAHFNVKGCRFVLLKPNTFMNSSGKAVRYWLQQEKVPIENLLVISDDIYLDFGVFRLKPKGSAGGHNGLKDIELKLKTALYARFRFGVGSTFSKGRQVDHVLSDWSREETSHLLCLLDKAAELVLSFAFVGIQKTMNQFNGSFKMVN